MKALIFVESPLQLLNAVEAIHFFKILKFKIILRLSGLLASDAQLLNTLNFLDINPDYVERIKINASDKGVMDFLKIIFFGKRYFFSKLDFIFIGNIESGFFRKVKNQFKESQVIYLDDGAKTLCLNKNMAPKKSLFSIFDIPGKVHYLNQYESLKKNICKNTFTVKDNEILFLGQKLAELNIISEGCYIDLVTRFALEQPEYKIIYVPHRGETFSKIEEIAEVSNIQILTLDYPVELYACFNKTLPYKVVSFYSTALHTMKVIYALESQCIEINVINDKMKLHIDMVYQFYLENNVVDSVWSD